MISRSKSYVLGLQHLFAMFGATVLVPMLTGLNPSIALLTAGVGTLIFHYVTGKKVPVFLGSSFAFIPAIQIVMNQNPDNIPLVQGGTIVAGLIYVLLAGLVALLGAEKVKSFLPPIVTGPVIIVIGLTLSPTAVEMASSNWWVALFVVAVVVGITIFNKGFFRLIPILIGIAAGYILSIILDITGITGQNPLINMQIVADADWFNFGAIMRGEFFTVPVFNAAAISLIAPIALVTFMEHVGDITTNGAVVKKDFFKEPGLHRTLIGDGLATSFAGLLGGPANTTYSENTGVLAVTKVYDPKILRIAAVYAIILAFVGKLGAILQTIPLPVMGGISLILFGMISSIGMRTIAEADLDFSKSRNLIISSLIFVIGIGVNVFYAETGGIPVPITDNFAFSGLFLATVIGVIANKILPKDV
jgi:uracil permease